MTTPLKKSNRGGFRPGAGRPVASKEGARVTLHCKVLPSTLRKIKQAAKKAGSDGLAVDLAVNQTFA